jgi:small subunit ribosomal protein S8
MRKIPTVEIKKNGIIDNLLAIMKREGYIADYKQSQKSPYHFDVELKYTKDGKPVIDGIERVSKGSRRVYVGKEEIPSVFNNYGVASSRHRKA